MRNLQYESRICQKSHNTVTITVYISNFYESDFNNNKNWFLVISFMYLVVSVSNGRDTTLKKVNLQIFEFSFDFWSSTDVTMWAKVKC